MSSLAQQQQPRSPPPRPLKRSASQASISLLTPPRTYRRRARGRSRGSCDSDSDDDARGQSSEDEDDELPQHDDGDRKRQAKKRRLNSAKANSEDEEAKFWGGAAGESSSTKTEDPKPSTSTRSKKPLLYQRFKTQSLTSSVSSLVSPPPSNRKTGVLPPAARSVTPSPPATETKASVALPVTPVHGTKRRAETPEMLKDSPSNPFVATPDNQEEEEVESASELPPSDVSPTPAYDRPTVTYVFRGVKRVYVNPMYNHEEGRPLSPPPNSKLPVDHPLFSPDPTCKPKLLFPEAHSRKRKGNSSKKRVAAASPTRGRSAWDSDSDEGEGVGEIGRAPPPALQLLKPRLKKTHPATATKASATTASAAPAAGMKKAEATVPVNTEDDPFL